MNFTCIGLYINSQIFILLSEVFIVGIDKDYDLLHFAGVSPSLLYTMKSNDQSVSCLDLYDVFPTNRHRYQPSIRITSLGSTLPTSVLLHEQVVGISNVGEYIFSCSDFSWSYPTIKMIRLLGMFHEWCIQIMFIWFVLFVYFHHCTKYFTIRKRKN